MTIRIKGNSIRYRLTRTEIKIFETEGYFEECVDFGSDTFTYALQKSISEKNLYAEFSENKILMTIPEKLADEWTKTEHVGFGHQQIVGGGKILFLLLEKDFKCLDKVAEDQSDHYENPLVLKKI
jgi:hypothetical protein